VEDAGTEEEEEEADSATHAPLQAALERNAQWMAKLAVPSTPESPFTQCGGPVDGDHIVVRLRHRYVRMRVRMPPPPSPPAWLISQDFYFLTHVTTVHVQRAEINFSLFIITLTTTPYFFKIWA
jgi:hypothetical protein